MSSLLTQNNSHIFICGQTRSGKTYFTSKALAQLRRPVIFFNIQEELLPPTFINVRYNQATVQQILEALRSGAKIDLRLPDDLDAANTIIGFIIDKLMTAGYSEDNPIYIAIDECHILSGAGLKSAEQSAVRGLKRGCRCIYITQRPAFCSKTLYTQSAEQYIFYLAPAETTYIKSKGIDYDVCKEYWQQLGMYSYIYYDGYELIGRKKV